ncbi:hypothetical protein B7W85_13060 [Allorhizobium ampelinum]|uniref:hypothetical protein n=1 Tax=Allorhizobium ampelinum TaxID=3025782 RepID=UPI000B3FFF79|nr:hypothetical protein [Allorhizobium ampelinum]OVE94475.1 hypothetical protein B7W85_13060 [Allorhizobium ampelinum]
MTKIPDDIDLIATGIVRNASPASADVDPDYELYLSIAKAILAERERCAAIVETISHDGLHESMWRNRFKNVADLIRKRR